MPVTITAAVNAADYSVELDIAGLTVGAVYALERRPAGGAWAGLRTWQATAGSERWADIAVAYNTPVEYRIGTVTSNTVQLAWASLNPGDIPMFDTSSGGWPVLRVANDPAVPFVRLPVSDYSADYGYRTHVMPILGSSDPVVASDVMQRKQGTVVFLTPDVDSRHRLLASLQPGKVMHLRAPCVDGLGDLYFRTLDVQESVPLRARPLLRAWQVEFQAVARPTGYGLVEWNRGRTWADVRTQDATWAGVKQVGTWRQVRDKGVVSFAGARGTPVGGDW